MAINKTAVGIGGGTAAAAALAAMLAIATPNVSTREGLRLVPYKDVNGVWTICNGDTIGVFPGMQKTTEECGSLLTMRLAYFGKRVDDMVIPPMTPMRWAGLTSFAYNVGLGTFEKSTLLKKLNANDPEACEQILRFTYVGKMNCALPKYQKKCGGIVIRRRQEYGMCLADPELVHVQ